MKRSILLPLVVAAGLSSFGAPVIGPRLAVPANVNEGRLLWNELDCGACHSGGGEGGRVGPVLGKEGLRFTPQFVRVFLNDPAGTKHGTTMPDVLHGKSAAEKAEAVEALTLFLARQPDANEKSFAVNPARIAQGRLLFHTVGCVACHAPQESWQTVMNVEPKNAPIDAELLDTNSVPIGPLASKTTVAQLAAFLREPAKYRKNGRMPSLKLTEGESESIAMYLLRAQAEQATGPGAPPKTLTGLNYEYFEADFGNGEPNWDALKVVTTGTSESFSLDAKKREQSFGFRFTGLINVKTNGVYKFWTLSDDSSRLWIDDKLVVDNRGEHAPEEKNGSLELAAGAHSITLTYYNNGAGSELKVAWQPPGTRRQPIPANILAHVGLPMLPIGEEKFEREVAKIEKGKALFGSLGCAACHEHSEVAAPKAGAKIFGQLTSTGGCLDEKVGTGLPDYHLDSEQRAALGKFLSEKATVALPPPARVALTMAELNCVACHTRDGKGGPTNARLQYFVGIGQADLGDEGRIPPHLTKVGLKLRREAMVNVLEKSAEVRPYMATRMPQFGRDLVGMLPDLFEQADGGETQSEPAGTAMDEKWGRKLAGVGGLSCISCHTFANHKSLGIPAVDMTAMTRRLKKDWFRRYLQDPPSLRPGTRMPSFWPGGEAANKEILGGNTEAQINAIWAFLSKGRDADLPAGLVQGKKEIVADKEAVIYRNFIRGATPRAIGVGYPEKANLVFDANTMTVAEIWQGAFMDAARHSSGRGEGFEPPLGDRIYALPAGPPLAVLDNPDAAWPKEGKGFRMRGYQLDAKRRPLFRYEFGEIKVEDFPEAFEGEVDPYLRRTMKLRGDGTNIWFRVATGSKIEKQADGSWLVDGKVNFKVNGTARVRQNELLVPVTFKGGEAEIVEEIRW